MIHHANLSARHAAGLRYFALRESEKETSIYSSSTCALKRGCEIPRNVCVCMCVCCERCFLQLSCTRQRHHHHLRISPPDHRPEVAWYRLSHRTLCIPLRTQCVCVDTDATLLPIPLSLSAWNARTESGVRAAWTRDHEESPFTRVSRERERTNGNITAADLSRPTLTATACVCVYVCIVSDDLFIRASCLSSLSPHDSLRKNYSVTRTHIRVISASPQ